MPSRGNVFQKFKQKTKSFNAFNVLHHKDTKDSDGSFLAGAGEEEAGSTTLRSSTVVLRRSQSGTIKLLQKERKEKDGTEELSIVTRDGLRNILLQRQIERNSCFFLPFSLLFFLLYTAMVAQHEDTYLTFETEEAIRQFVDSTSCNPTEDISLESVDSPEDIWYWMKNSIVCDGSQWFRQKDVAGRPLERSEWGRVLGSDRLFGGLLLEQSRTEKATCSMDLPFDWECYPSDKTESAPFGSWGSDSNQTSLEFSEAEAAGLYFAQEGFVPLFDKDQDARRLRSQTLNWGSNAEIKREKWEKFSFFLLEWEPLEKLQRRLKYLENGGWLDSQTEQVLIKAIFVNPEVGLMTRLSLLFDFARTGGLNLTLRLQSAPLLAYRSSIDPLVDISWVLLLIGIAVNMGRDILREHRRQRLAVHMRSPWNWLDIFTFIFGLIIVFGFVVQRAAIDGLLEKMAQIETDVEVTRSYLQFLRDVHHLADWTFKGTMWYRLLLGDFVLLVLLRFFKAFRAQPRLSLVTTTIYAAGADLFHFSVVFVSIFTSFTFASVILFGRRMREFSTFPWAAATCCANHCGDFDGAWQQVAADHPTTALLWFWSFIILIFFVMLNMVLAIVLDVYTEVRTNAINGDPLWVQAAKVLRRIRDGGFQGLVRMGRIEKDLLAAIDNCNEELSHKDVVAICPDIDEELLEDIMDQCNRLEARQQAKGLSLSDALTMVGVLHSDVKKLSFDIKKYLLKKKSRQGADDTSSQEADNKVEKRLSPDKFHTTPAGTSAPTALLPGECEDPVTNILQDGDVFGISNNIVSKVVDCLRDAIRSGDLSSKATAPSQTEISHVRRVEEVHKNVAGQDLSQVAQELRELNELLQKKRELLTKSFSPMHSPRSNTKEASSNTQEVIEAVRGAVAVEMKEQFQAIRQDLLQLVAVKNQDACYERTQLEGSYSEDRSMSVISPTVKDGISISKGNKISTRTSSRTSSKTAEVPELVLAQLQCVGSSSSNEALEQTAQQPTTQHLGNSQVGCSTDAASAQEVLDSETAQPFRGTASGSAEAASAPAHPLVATEESLAQDKGCEEVHGNCAFEPEQTTREVAYQEIEQPLRGADSSCTDAAQAESTQHLEAGNSTSSAMTPLRPGMRIRIKGLQTRPDLNGQEGSVCEYDNAQGRWQVRIDDGSGMLLKAMNLQACGDVESGVDPRIQRFPHPNAHLKPGARVRLCGLETFSRLNGCEGELVEFDLAKERWKVFMDDGSGKMMKAENLEVCLSNGALRSTAVANRPAPHFAPGVGDTATPLLAAGARICVVGLRSRLELNGQEGYAVECCDVAQDLWRVRLDDGSGKVFKSVNLRVVHTAGSGQSAGGHSSESAALGGFAPGARVRLVGLHHAQELNGQEGILVEFDASQDRWKVRMDNASGKIIRSENLQVLTQASQSATAGSQQPGGTSVVEMC